ncbi:uncharacterized protein IUM83_02616 [Phytophthora cinnamomi]|nr:hypothetical protein IUM83_02616 [Phytophthora cinnamomi]
MSKYEKGGDNDGSQESVDFSASKPGREVHDDKDVGRSGSQDVASKPAQGGKGGRPSQYDNSSDSQDAALSYPRKGDKGSKDKTGNDSQDVGSLSPGKGVKPGKDDDSHDSVDAAASNASHDNEILQAGSRQADDDTPVMKFRKGRYAGDQGSQGIVTSKPGRGGESHERDDYSDSNDVASKRIENDDSQDVAKGRKGGHPESESGDSADAAAWKPNKGGKPESSSSDSDDSAASKPRKGGKSGKPESANSDSQDVSASMTSKGGKQEGERSDSDDTAASKPNKGGSSGKQIDRSNSKGDHSKPNKGSSSYTTAPPTAAASTEAARLLGNVDEWLVAFKRGF